MTQPLTKPKKRKKTKSQTATARADKYFSLLVRREGICERCRAGDTQCAHGFSRRYRNTRWTFANAWELCRGCHLYFTMRPLEWDEWMRSCLGADYDTLRAMALSTEKLVDVKERAVELEQLWKDSQ